MNIIEGCVYLNGETCITDGKPCTYPNCDGHQPVNKTELPPGEEMEADEAGGDREIQ